MQLNEYQKLAQRTSRHEMGTRDKVSNGVLGLCGEAGECADLWKKHMYQGHEFDLKARESMVDELGDVLWYVAETAFGIGASLDEIAEHNIAKLKQRYPNGFESEKSINREG